MIDDLEDGDRFICESAARKGFWYLQDDGTSTNLSPKGDVLPVAIPGGRDQSQRAVRITGGGFKSWGVWLGLSLNGDPEAEEEVYDASGADGVRFWMKNNVPVQLWLPTSETLPVESGGTCVEAPGTFNCGNFFGYTIGDISPGAWVQYDVPFSAALQPSAMIDDAGNFYLGSASFEPSHLYEVDLAIAPNQLFDVWIDDVSFYTCEGAGCVPTCGPYNPVACPGSAGVAAGCWPAGVDCASLLPFGLIAVWGSGPADVWAAGDDGIIAHWDGARWARSAAPVANELPYYYTHLWGTGPNDVWAVGTRGVIVHWDGARWSPVPSGTDVMLTDVWGSGPADVWATGSSGTILHWDGVAWSTNQTGATATLDGIWGSGADDIWAVGYLSQPFGDALGGIIDHWDGAAWSEMPLAAGTNVQSIWGSGPGDVWAVGARGTIVHWNGTTWTLTPSGTITDAFTGIWGSGPDDVWAVGYKGTIVHWNGLAWSIATHAPTSLGAVWASGAGDAWAVGTNGTILHWDGATWSAVSNEGLRP
jgi:hypothetical protein